MANPWGLWPRGDGSAQRCHGGSGFGRAVDEPRYIAQKMPSGKTRFLRIIVVVPHRLLGGGSEAGVL